MTLMIFEQPTSEVCRVLLRLEHLFVQLSEFSGNPRHLSVAVRFLVDIISVLDRPDLKSKLTQELHRFIAHFSKQPPSAELQELRQMLDYLGSLEGKLGQILRDHEFLSNLRMRIYTPAGDCGFEIPSYQQWLIEAPARALEDFASWCMVLDPVLKLTELLLKLIRAESVYRDILAPAGFYHEALQQTNCQLLRLKYDVALGIYPEISVGKHRLSIRFYRWVMGARPQQTDQDIHCQLACCCI